MMERKRGWYGPVLVGLVVAAMAAVDGLRLPGGCEEDRVGEG